MILKHCHFMAIFCSVWLLCSSATASPLLSSSLSIASSSAAFLKHAPNGQDGQSLVVKSAQHAVQLAQRQYPSKVLRVQPTSVNGNPGYRLKLLTHDGVIFYVLVDAQTGGVYRN